MGADVSSATIHPNRVFANVKTHAFDRYAALWAAVFPESYIISTFSIARKRLFVKAETPY